MSVNTEFTVDPAHLTADANKWDDISAVVTAAVDIAVADTEVERFTMDGLSVAAGLKDAYDTEQDAAVAYLLEGKQYIATIGQTLREMRDAYLLSDEYATWQIAQAAQRP